MARRFFTRRTALGAVALLIAATPLVTPAGASASSKAAAKYASLGKQVCSSDKPFVYMLFSRSPGPDLIPFCYDGTASKIPLGNYRGSDDKGLLAIAIDNQTGRRVWLAGSDANGGKSFNYCYSKGLSWALGASPTGGQLNQDLLVNSMSRGSTAACSKPWSPGAGTNDPGDVPAEDPGCRQADRAPKAGPQVFIVASPTYPGEDTVNNFTQYDCISGHGSTATSKLHGHLLILANGTGHPVLVSGSGMSTACVSNNHVIEPVSPAIASHASKITIMSGSRTTCP